MKCLKTSGSGGGGGGRGGTCKWLDARMCYYFGYFLGVLLDFWIPFGPFLDFWVPLWAIPGFLGINFW